MISFDLGAARFNYRVVGVALHAGRVLLSRAEHDDFRTLPEVPAHVVHIDSD